MTAIKCEKKIGKMKSKKLRREGYVPCVIYGKNMDAPVSAKISHAEISKMFKTSALGSQVQLDVEGEIYDTMIKKIDREPLSANLMHLDFQVLTLGEKIKTSVHIKFVNPNPKLDGILQEIVNTVEYEVLPKDMIADAIEVDISELSLEKDIKVEDLEIAKDERYNILTPLTTTLIRVTEAKGEAATEEAEAADAEVEVVE